jgi:hypothetical protein
MRWVWRGTALVVLWVGWVFIAWQNHFHITAPVVFVCLAFLAVVATVYNLWRTGAAAVSTGDDGDDSTWAKPAGRLGELEREKRTLLKAIKEAEFDHQMGKLSQHDADEMIRVYRARAIEVIKDIDHLGLGAAGTPREQIMREVRARLELDAKASKKVDPKRAAAETGAKGKKAKDKGAAGKAAAADGTAAKADAAVESAAAKAAAADSAAAGGTATKADAAAESAAKASAAGETAAAGGAATKADAAAESAAASAAPAGAASLDDDAMDADSTTAIDPARDHRAKEATP